MIIEQVNVCSAGNVVESIQPLLNCGWTVVSIESKRISATLNGFADENKIYFTFKLVFDDGKLPEPFNGELLQEDYQL